MSTDAGGTEAASAPGRRRRVALVLAAYGAREAPPGSSRTPWLPPVWPTRTRWRPRCRASGPASSDLRRSASCSGRMGLWIEDGLSVRELAGRVAGEADELVLLPADAPDLPPPLVLAKMFKVLHRVDVVVAPQRGGGGCLALGLALPLAAWVPEQALDLEPRPAAGAGKRRGAAQPLRVRTGLAPAPHRRRPDEARPQAGGVGGDPSAALRHACGMRSRQLAARDPLATRAAHAQQSITSRSAGLPRRPVPARSRRPRAARPP